MNSSLPEAPPRGLPQACLDALRDILPEDGLLVDEEELRPYECDGLPVYRGLPGAVALPLDTAQVQAVLRCCHAHGVPVIARGAGTGLSGGALPRGDALVLGLSRLNRILEIDADNRLAVVQPGVRNLQISQAAEPHGLFYAPDPSSQIACSIGGNVAENSGGVHCVKYGLTVHNILGLRVLDSEGRLHEIGGPRLATPGADLLSLFTGSEGLLGIVTEVTVRLLPRPPASSVLLMGFDRTADAARTVAAIFADGLLPAGLEMMDSLAIRAAEDFVHAGYPEDAEALLLCELDGTEAEVREQAERVRAIAEAHDCSSLQEARDPDERARLWAGRKAAFPAVGRLSPDYYCMDGTIPRARLPEVLARIEALSREYGLRVANVFHAGDGNLHPLILYDANVPGELERTEEMGRAILRACLEAGGTITGEHGVGTEKLDSMCEQFTPAELEQMHAVKQALDPAGLLNPGKAVPSLHRCAELGAMHVHHGKLPFPDLERF